MSPYRMEHKGKNKQIGLCQNKTAKEIISQMKREPTAWENIFANDTLDNGQSLYFFNRLFHRPSLGTNEKN